MLQDSQFWSCFSSCFWLQVLWVCTLHYWLLLLHMFTIAIMSQLWVWCNAVQNKLIYSTSHSVSLVHWHVLNQLPQWKPMQHIHLLYLFWIFSVCEFGQSLVEWSYSLHLEHLLPSLLVLALKPDLDLLLLLLSFLLKLPEYCLSLDLLLPLPKLSSI